MNRTPLRRLPLAVLLLLPALAGCPRASPERVVDLSGFTQTGSADDVRGACADDEREEDDGVAWVLAKVTREGEKVEGVSCPGDDDFVHLEALGQLVVEVTWNAGEGAVKVELLDERGAAVPLGRGTDLAEVAEGRALLQRLGAAGSHYLRIRNRSGTPVRYRVQVGGAG